MLIVLADTDISGLNNTALALHRGLHDAGAQVRSVALAPGRSGGLDPVVPVLAPTARSLASILQLRREQRWADAVICVGSASASVQRLTGAARRGAVFRLDPDSPDAADPGAWMATLESAMEHTQGGRPSGGPGCS